MKPAPAPQAGAVAIAWLALAAVMAVAGGGFRLSFAVGAAIVAIAAVGVDVCVGSAGLLVFSSPAFMLVGGLASALVARHSDLAPTSATLLGLAAGLAAGAVLAVVVGAVLRRVHGIGVALVTLFVLQLVRGVARQQESLGGTLGLSGVPPFEVGPFRAATPAAQAIVVMAALAVVLAVATLFVRSGRGLELRAGAGDATAAAASGVAVGRRRIQAFVFGSLCATLAGSLYAHVLGYVSADSFGLATLMDQLLMVFLGGAGSLWGVVPGALAVGVIPDLWLGPSRFDMLIRGAAFLAVLTVAPTGLAGTLRRLTGRGGRAPAPTVLRPQGRPVDPRPMAQQYEPVLEAGGLRHSFGAVRALDDVALTLQPGEVCAVIGANGAGKTTLFDVLSGHLRPDAGCISFRGSDITGADAYAYARLGVARTFQEVRLFSGLTVFEHALVGTGSPQQASAIDTARGVLEFTKLSAVADAAADELPFGSQRRVELARSLAAQPALLLLDEPASGLSATERADLAAMLKDVPGRPAILLVEHDVVFALSVAGRVIVLEAGRVLFDGPSDDVIDAGVLDAYLGRSARPAPKP